MVVFLLFLHVIALLFPAFYQRWLTSPPPVFGGRKISLAPAITHHAEKKPEWVTKEVVRMKALMPSSGCRKLADSFNRRFAHKGMSVGKTFISDTIRKHQYEIQIIRKKLKHRKPKPMPLNRVWAMDLTGKQDAEGKLHHILGLMEHGSRANLSLVGLKDKASITLLRHLLDTLERYGKPKYLRTDNEAVFTSRVFRFGLWLLGIRHQRTDIGCPWMNGRVERFFGTLKEKLNGWEVDSLEQLNAALVPFRFWYNHVRPHQHLDGRTPAEVWAGKDIFEVKPRKAVWFEAWEGLLTGYYVRC